MLGRMQRTVALAVLLMSIGVAASAAPAAPSEEAGVTLDAARAVLPGDDGCLDVACLIERAYALDQKAQALARALWTEHGDVVGVGVDEVIDGGYRGQIHLVPQLPTGRYRAHLVWLREAAGRIDQFFRDHFAGHDPPRYRWRALTFRVVRSPGKRTPSASVAGWTINYNVHGSLLTSATGVTETLFHEIFHANDEAHGDWSSAQLRTDYDAIAKRCGTELRCLEPYAPNDTRVRGGTYYAFQRNNGDAVHEYAAELAVRYWKEQREMRAAGKLGRPAFKCGPPENRRAWQALVAEFFAGRDLVPDCP